MYELIKFLHVASVFLFLLSHGASANVSFQLKNERKPERIRALLDLSNWSFIGMGVGFLLLLITGIIDSFAGPWADHNGWIWVSIGLLLAITVSMSVLGSMFYTKVRAAVGVPPYKRSDQQALGETKSEEEIAKLLNTNQPIILSLIGFGGILIIAYLMMFKPF
ncbi:MAG TPA: DUF2269 family protein [Anaerolineae bacterium]|nr:DUF2269 family protein [Anaerolineae bacterium]